ELGKGIVEVAVGPGLWLDQFSELSVTNGIPITWTALLARSEKPGASLRTIGRASALPGEVYPQIASRPVVMQLNLADPGPLAVVDEWKEVLAVPREQRAAMYRDESWRARARPATLEGWKHRFPMMDVEETKVNGDAVGIPLDRLAAERGTTAFDLMLDLALADDLVTRFRIVMDNDAE